MNAKTPRLHRETPLTSTCVLLLLWVFVSGCGSHTQMGCVQTGINVIPNPASADHNAAAPGNSVHFLAAATFTGCAPPPPVDTNVTWSVGDTTNVSISNVQGPNFGTATCKGPTAGATTVTATGPLPDGTMATSTASLACQ